MKKQKIITIGAIVILFGAFWFGRGHLAPKANDKPRPKQTFEQPKSTIVKLDNPSQLDNFKKANNLNDNQLKPSRRLGYYVVDKKPEQIVSAKDHKIYPNLQYRVQLSPNDTYLSSQWYLDKIAAKRLWDFSTGSGSVTTAVIDTGFALAHQDLSGQWAINPGEYGSGKESNGLDDDGDGYVDNWRGWNFYGSNNNPQAGVTNPGSIYVSHGSSTAGVIGAAGNNGLGVAGLSWQGKLLPLQTMSDDGIGYTSDIADAVDYATAHGAKVINLSLGTNSQDNFLKQSIDDAIAAGVTVVAAAGNDGCDCMLYPANYPEVIAVGSTNQSDARSSFSSYGANLDLMAPGESILAPKWTAGGNAYSYSSGTSLATPMVSGTAALILARKPTAAPAEINQLLHLRSDAIGGQTPQALNNYFGYGRLNAMKAASLLTFQNGALVQGSDGKVYLIEGGKKRHIISPAALLSHRFSFSGIQIATEAQINALTTGEELGLADGSLVRNPSSGQVFLIEDAKKRWILSPTILKNQAPKTDIMNLDSNELSNYTDGQAIFTQHHPGDLIENGGAIYLLAEVNSETVKKHIISPATMDSYGYRWAEVSRVSNDEANSYETAEDVGIKPGTLAYDSSQNKVYVVSLNGQATEKRWITSPQLLQQLYANRPILTVPTQEMSQYNDGTMIVDASALPDGVVARDSSGKVYLIEGGKKRYIISPQAADSWSISLGWTVNQLNDQLGSMDDGENVSYAEGSLLSENGKVYDYFGQKVRWILSGNTFNELNYGRKKLYRVDSNQVAALTVASPIGWLPLTGALIRDSAGRVFLVYGSTKHWITSPLIFNTQGYSVAQIYQLGDSETTQYSNGQNVTVRSGELVYADDGKVYVLEGKDGESDKAWVRDGLILDLLFMNKTLYRVPADQLSNITTADDINLD